MARHRTIQEWWDNPELRHRVEHWSYDKRATKRYRRVRSAIRDAVVRVRERLVMETL